MKKTDSFTTRASKERRATLKRSFETVKNLILTRLNLRKFWESYKKNKEETKARFKSFQWMDQTGEGVNQRTGGEQWNEGAESQTHGLCFVNVNI